MSDMVAKAAQLLETDVSVHQTETEADWEPDKKRNKKQKKQAYMDEATVYKGHVKTARSSVTGMPTTKKSRIHINPLAQRIQHLRDCQVAGLITCEEFEKTKSAILKSFVEDQAKFVRTLTVAAHTSAAVACPISPSASPGHKGSSSKYEEAFQHSSNLQRQIAQFRGKKMTDTDAAEVSKLESDLSFWRQQVLIFQENEKAAQKTLENQRRETATLWYEQNSQNPSKGKTFQRPTPKPKRVFRSSFEV